MAEAPVQMETRRRRLLLRFLRALLAVSQRLRFDVLPRHFYSQVPDLRALRDSTRWRRPYAMRGIAGAEIEPQLEFVRRLTDGLDTAAARPPIHSEACRRNGAAGYGPIEAELLYAFVAKIQPPRVIQVGAGVATAVMLRAAEEHGFPIRITCVDPYPTDYLAGLAERGTIELVPEPAESLEPERLAELESGSLLFVDSTHAVRPGSDVNRIVLGVLPVLRRGVFVHFHDIVFPYDYMPHLLDDDLFFWSESALLQAFLTDNRRAELRVAMSMLHHGAAAELRELLPSYRPATQEDGISINRGHGEHYPSAAYLEIVG